MKGLKTFLKSIPMVGLILICMIAMRLLHREYAETQSVATLFQMAALFATAVVTYGSLLNMVVNYLKSIG